jgi:hypothetical protein
MPATSIDPTVKHRCISGLQGNIGAAAHGDPHIGGGQRGRVIDAVADLRHGLALRRLQLAHDTLLVLRQQFCPWLQA